MLLESEKTMSTLGCNGNFILNTQIDLEIPFS